MAKKDKSTSLGKVGRVERERRYNALIQFGLIGVVVLVIILLVGGAIWEGLIKPNQPVAIVGDQEILTKDFEVHVRYTRSELLNQYQFYSYLYQTALDETQQQSYISALTQIEFALTPGLVGQRVLDQMIDDLIIRNEAKSLNIEVSDEEIDEILASTFGYYPNGNPTPSITSTLSPSATLSETQLALVTIPPTITNTPPPTEGFEATSTQQTTPTATIVPLPTPEPTNYSSEQYETNQIAYFDSIGISVEEARMVIEARLYRQKVRDALTADLPTEQEQVWIRQLLFQEVETAEDFIVQLDDGGDWNELAAEFFPEDPFISQTGGDLGWVSADRLIPNISEIAFELQVGTVSSPIESESGWFVIQLIGRELRPLDSFAYENYRDDEFNDWLLTARGKITDDIVYMDYWEKRTPEDPKLQAAPQAGGLFGPQ